MRCDDRVQRVDAAPLQDNDVPKESGSENDEGDAHPLGRSKPTVAWVSADGALEPEEVENETSRRVHEDYEHSIGPSRQVISPEKNADEGDAECQKELQSPQVVAGEVAVDEGDGPEGRVCARPSRTAGFADGNAIASGDPCSARAPG